MRREKAFDRRKKFACPLCLLGFHSQFCWSNAMEDKQSIYPFSFNCVSSPTSYAWESTTAIQIEIIPRETSRSWPNQRHHVFGGQSFRSAPFVSYTYARSFSLFAHAILWFIRRFAFSGRTHPFAPKSIKINRSSSSKKPFKKRVHNGHSTERSPSPLLPVLSHQSTEVYRILKIENYRSF